MILFFKAIFIAGVIALAAQVVRSFFPILREYHIPISFVGGLIALILGNQVSGHFFNFAIIDAEISEAWSEMTLPLVNIIFACLFLGRVLPSLRKGLSMAAPQAAFGQTLAWGQYFIGGVVTLLILKPYFDATDVFASLIEISFQGGVGVAIGMGPTFDSLGSSSATPVAIALAPSAMLIGIISGIIMINLYKDRAEDGDDDLVKEMVSRNEKNADESEPDSDSDEMSNGFTRSLLIQFALVGLTIWLAIVFLDILRSVESELLVGVIYQSSLAQHIPVFPIALLAGLVVQVVLNTFKLPIANPQIMRKIEIFALEAVIIMAIGNLDIKAIGANFEIFLILLTIGTLLNIVSFRLLAPRILPKYWLQRGIADYGQSMGTTSIGLMLQSLIDPKNKSSGRESFGIKQIFFEPFVGGGIITALSPIIIHSIGLIAFTLCSAVLCFIAALTGFIIKNRYSD